MSEALPAPVNRSSEELEMRALIVPELRRRWPNARIIHELPLRYSTVRIDLAAVTPDRIISVEIKSSKDVLDRLERQVRAFLPISARVIVALAPDLNADLGSDAVPRRRRRRGAEGFLTYEEHVPRLTEAQAILERINDYYQDTWTVDAAAGSIIAIKECYRERTLPWLAQMLDMLHVAELSEIAGRHRIVRGRRDNHAYLLEQCAALMNGREIIAAVCRALRARDAFAAGSDVPIVERAPE